VSNAKLAHPGHTGQISGNYKYTSFQQIFGPDTPALPHGIRIIFVISRMEANTLCQNIGQGG